jgi:uncharacterized protein (TIGR02677 family)
MHLTPFAHVNAEKAPLYRNVMQIFVSAKERFLVHLRPEDVHERLSEAAREEVDRALQQLVEWGNLQAEPDTGRVSTVEDFYRARYLYQLTKEGEAAEIALAAYDEALGQRGALQAVALEDIRHQLRTLQGLVTEASPDPARVHFLLRDLSRVFADLAENAQAFMAGLGRTLELRSADREAFLAYKERLIDYLQRFIGELVTASADIARLIREIGVDGEGTEPSGIERLLRLVADREARDALEDDGETGIPAAAHHLERWRARWEGLSAWFVGARQHPSQAELLRNRARRAIPELLDAARRLNEQRLGRSDRAADFRTLARWFAEAESEADAHRLWRAAFGLAPARHLTADEETLAARDADPIPASMSWLQAPPLLISARLRATGSCRKKGQPPRVVRRDRERELLARQLAEESTQARAARRLLATGEPVRLSAVGRLEPAPFALFLRLLGEALSAAADQDREITTLSGDGSLRIFLTPLGPETRARIETPHGTFGGRDYLLCITDLEEESEPRRAASGERP